MSRLRDRLEGHTHAHAAATHSPESISVHRRLGHRVIASTGHQHRSPVQFQSQSLASRESTDPNSKTTHAPPLTEPELRCVSAVAPFPSPVPVVYRIAGRHHHLDPNPPHPSPFLFIHHLNTNNYLSKWRVSSLQPVSSQSTGGWMHPRSPTCSSWGWQIHPSNVMGWTGCEQAAQTDGVACDVHNEAICSFQRSGHHYRHLTAYHRRYADSNQHPVTRAAHIGRCLF